MAELRRSEDRSFRLFLRAVASDRARRQIGRARAGDAAGVRRRLSLGLHRAIQLDVVHPAAADPLSGDAAGAASAGADRPDCCGRRPCRGGFGSRRRHLCDGLEADRLDQRRLVPAVLRLFLRRSSLRRRDLRLRPNDRQATRGVAGRARGVGDRRGGLRWLGLAPTARRDAGLRLRRGAGGDRRRGAARQARRAARARLLRPPVAGHLSVVLPADGGFARRADQAGMDHRRRRAVADRCGRRRRRAAAARPGDPRRAVRFSLHPSGLGADRAAEVGFPAAPRRDHGGRANPSEGRAEVAKAA